MAERPISEYTNEELLRVISGQPAQPEAPAGSGAIERFVGDPLRMLASGTVGLGRAAVGLADIPTGGYAGELIDRGLGRLAPGYNMEKIQQSFRDLYTPEAKAAMAPIEQARGAGETAKAIMESPTGVLPYLVETLPSLAVPIGAAGRAYSAATTSPAIINAGLRAAREAGVPATAATARFLGTEAARRTGVAAAGRAATTAEGLLAAGDVAENIRQETGPGAEVLYGVPAGFATAALGRFAGRLTGGPLEAILARRGAGEAGGTMAQGILGRTAIGAATEAGEEAAQSASEQAFTNIGTGAPVLEGVGKQAVLGGVLGGIMGGGLGALTPGSVSTDALAPTDVKYVDPLGDQREQFISSLSVLKEKYVNDVSVGVPEATAFREYQIAAQDLKDRLLASTAVSPEALAAPSVREVPAEQVPVFGTQPDAELLGVLEGADLSPMAPALDMLGEAPTGAQLAEAIATADPGMLAELRNATLMALAENNAPAEYVGMVTDIFDAPETAVARAAELDAAVQAMQESRDAFDASVIDDVLLNNPEVAEALTQSMEAAGIAPTTEGRPPIGDRVRALSPELRQQMVDAGIITQEEMDRAIQEQEERAPTKGAPASAAQAEFEGKVAKGKAMRAAADKRKATGKLTAKEKAAAAKQEAGNYKGKRVSVDGKQGEVLSAPFGKVRIKFDDGTTASVAPDSVSPAQKTAVEAATQVASELPMQDLPGITRTARATIQRPTLNAMVRVMFGEPATVVRGEDNMPSKEGTAHVARWKKSVTKIVELSRRLDKLMAKASPRVFPSTFRIDERIQAIDDALALLSGKKVPMGKLLQAKEAYGKIRSGALKGGAGKRPSPQQATFMETLRTTVDAMPTKASNPTAAQMTAALTSLRDFLQTNTPGSNVMAAQFFDAEGDSIADLTDQLARTWDEALHLMGARKGSQPSIATAKANIDRIIGAYKKEKFAKNLAAVEDMDEYGAFETDAEGEAIASAEIAERNKFDYQISMAWSAYKDGRLPRLKGITTKTPTAPLSPVPNRPIRRATETGSVEDASQSPLADAYKNGYMHDPKDPNKATPPGPRAVLSYMAASSTGMTRVLSNLLKESLASRMPRKGNLTPENPIRMKFLTPEESLKFGVTSARWYNNTALQTLRQTDPSLPTDGEMVLVANPSPEAVLHEMFHASTASWVLANPNHKTVIALKAQLTEAIKRANAMTAGGLPANSPFRAVIATLQSIEAAGKGFAPGEARARQVAEFISYAMTRSSFQEFLSSIYTKDIEKTKMAYTPQERSFIDKMGNIWNAFLDAVRVMLGISTAVKPSDVRSGRDFMDYLVNRVILINQLAIDNPAAPTGKSFVADMVDVSTEAFKKFFGKSTIVDENGEPKIMYHGTARDIFAFRPKQAGAIFLTPSTKFAQQFAEMSETFIAREVYRDTMTVEQAIDAVDRAANQAFANSREGVSKEFQFSAEQLRDIRIKLKQHRADGTKPSTTTMPLPVEYELLRDLKNGPMMPSRANLMPVYVRAENPFDFDNKSHVSAVMKALERMEAVPAIKAQDILAGRWGAIENSNVQQAIRKLGFDGFYVMEQEVKNLAVYESKQIKSAAGNVGTFDTQMGAILDHQSVDANSAFNMSADQVSSARKSMTPRKMNVLDRITSAPFRILFPGLWGQDSAGVKAAETKARDSFDEYMRAHPWAAAALGPWVEFVGTTRDVRTLLEQYMRGREPANLLANRMEDALRDMPREQEALFMEALLDSTKRSNLSASDAALVQDAEKMIKKLQKDAAATGGLAPELINAPISELIQWAVDAQGKVSRRDLATSGFSAGVIALSGQKKSAIVENDVVLWDENVDPASPFDDRYYPVYAKQDPNVIEYFIASNRPADLAAAGADTTASWAFSKPTGSNKSTFVRNATYAEIRARAPNVPAAHFLANTLAEMSKVIAGRQLIDGLTRTNNDADEKHKFIFDSEADMRAALGDNVKFMELPSNPNTEDRRLARQSDRFVLVKSGRYGSLKGKVVHGSVLGAIFDMHNDSPLINSGWYNDTVRFWKGTKTKWSPGTHVTNTLTNVTMLYMHDIPMSALSTAAQIYAKDIGSRTDKFKSKPMSAEQKQLFDLFLNSGAVLGNYSANELHRKMSVALAESFDADNDGSLNSITKMMAKYEVSKSKLANQALQGMDTAANTIKDKARALDRFTGGAYELEDNMFRFAAFIHEYNMQKATNPQISNDAAAAAAGKFAKYAMIDYSITARGVNALRQTAMPFLSWTYRAVPMMIRVAYTKPWKMINLMAVYYALNALGYAVSGGDEDEERKNLPSWMQQRVWGFGPHAYVRMPWGDSDNPVFWGAGKYLPGGDLVQHSDQGVFGLPYFPGALAPSGPVVALLSASFGWDSFQGRTLWTESNSATDNFLASAKYLASQMAPVNPYPAIENLVLDKNGLIGNDVNHMYALSRYFGSRLYQRNTDEDAYSLMKEVQALDRERNAAIARIVRAESRYGNPDWEAVQADVEKLNARMIEKINKKLGVEDGA
jgi:hypothetical protein